MGIIVGDPEVADEVVWNVTGHDAIKIYETLQSWMQDLTSATEAAEALGLSTTETWEWIRRKGGRSVG